MRTKTRTIILAVQFWLCTSSCLTQTPNPNMISLNFGTKEISGLDKLGNLAEGSTYTFAIENINLLLYKVSLVAKDSITERPLTLPTFGSFSVEPLKGLVSGLTALGTILGTTGPREPTKTIGVPVTDEGKASLRIKQEQDSLRGLMDRLAQLKTEIDDQALAAKEYLLSAQLEHVGNAAYKELGGSSFNFEITVRQIESLRSRLTGLQRSIAIRKSMYVGDMDRFKGTVGKNKELENADQETRGLYDRFGATIVEALESVGSDKTAELFGSIIAVENTKERRYVSLPFQLKGDVGSLKIEITPRNEKYNLQSYSTEIKFPWCPRGLFAVGTSFYISSLYDEAFTIKGIPGIVARDSSKDETVTKYTIVKEDPGQFEFGVQAMFTFGFLPSNVGSWQISIGPGLSVTNKVRPRLLAGVGYAFGRRNLLAVSIGAIVGAVDRKSIGVDLDAIYDTKPGDLTVSRLVVGYFFTLGYLFNL